MPIEPFHLSARRKLGPLWSLFLKEWGGFSDEAQLFSSDPSDMRGASRVFDACYVAGWRSPLFLAVSHDYLTELRRFWRRDDPYFNEDVLAQALSAVDETGHPAGWPLMSMSGRTFQLLVRQLEEKGRHVRPRLARSVVSGAEVSYLEDLARHAKLDDEQRAEILCDFGGGAYRMRDLDRAGFGRVEVAIEMKLAGNWRPGQTRP